MVSSFFGHGRLNWCSKERKKNVAPEGAGEWLPAVAGVYKINGGAPHLAIVRV
tara:strand:- start:4671 stop:4829 length:159 start_codon:yes stop_codon:yes gene_type:complete